MATVTARGSSRSSRTPTAPKPTTAGRGPPPPPRLAPRALPGPAL